jgi:hypothetical protein
MGWFLSWMTKSVSEEDAAEAAGQEISPARLSRVPLSICIAAPTATAAAL